MAVAAHTSGLARRIWGLPLAAFAAVVFCAGGLSGILLEVAEGGHAPGAGVGARAGAVSRGSEASPAAPGGSPPQPPPQPGPTSFLTTEDGGPPAAALADTPAGALAEGLQFEKTIGSSLAITAPTRFAEVMRRHFSIVGHDPGEQMIAGVLQQSRPLSQIVEAGDHFNATQAVVTQHLAGWSPDAAVLDFYTAVVSGTDARSGNALAPLQVLWSVDTLTLSHTANGWRIDHAVSTPGPAPQTSVTPTPPGSGLPPPMTWQSVAAGQPQGASPGASQ